mgnify:CR=1 FL=1
MKTKLQVRNLLVILILLLLSAINIHNLFLPTKVLGIRKEDLGVSDTQFWREFTKANPKYLPAYIEINETYKLKKLDPNFLP